MGRRKDQAKYICRAIDDFYSNNPQYRDELCVAVRKLFIDPITNADRIRAMTDEKLASYLTGVWYSFEEMPGMCDVCDKNSIQNCCGCWLDWLKQEIDDEL